MKVLLAEDSALLRAGLCQLLRAMGHHVVEVGDADARLGGARVRAVLPAHPSPRAGADAVAGDDARDPEGGARA